MGFGQQISLNGKPYNLVQKEGAYKVTEVPSHFDVDPRMERRVSYVDFSGGISNDKAAKTIDSGSSPYSRITLSAQGIRWGNGGYTPIADRLFVQRGVNTATAVTLPIVDFAEGSNYSVVATKSQIYSAGVISGGVQPLTLSKDFSVSGLPANAVITDIVAFAGKIWVAATLTDVTTGQPVYDNASVQAMWVWDQTQATATWTQLTYPGTYGAGLPAAGGSTDAGRAAGWCIIRGELWRFSGANMWSWNGLDAAWTGVTVVGDPNVPITAVDTYKDDLIVFKKDGLFSIDRVGQPYPAFPGFSTLGFNPRPVGRWRGSFYFAADVGLLWEWDGDAVKRVGFDSSEPFPMNSGTFGIPNVATRGVGLSNFMVVGFNQFYPVGAAVDANCYFMAYDGKGWNPFRMFTTGRATALGLLGGERSPSRAILQFGVSTGSNNGQLFAMEDPTLDPFLVTSFDTAVNRVYLPPDFGALEDEDKVLERVTAIVDNSNKGTVAFNYATDDGYMTNVYSPMGPAKVGNKGFFQQFVPPQKTPLSPLPNYKRIALAVDIQSNDGTASPQIRAITMHYKQRTPQRRVWDIEVLAETQVISAGGRQDQRDTAKIISDLNAARSQRNQVPFVDVHGVTYSVYVDEVGDDATIIKAAGGRTGNTSYMVKLKLVEAVTT